MKKAIPFLFSLVLALTAPAAYFPYNPSTKALQDSVVLPAGKTLTFSGGLAGTPTGGTLDLSNLTLTLPLGVGADGKLLTGSSAPSDGTGINGDAYLRTNGAFYVKASGTWGSPVATLAPTSTTLAGYGITDPIALTSGSYADPAWITSLAKSKVGLSNVDNTSDASKPISTATQTALDLKETPAGAQSKADAAQAAAIAASIPAGYLDTDTTLAANSDTKIPSQKAIKAYVATVLPLPTIAVLVGTDLTLDKSNTTLTTDISGPVEFGLADVGVTGSRVHLSATFTGTQTVTTDFAVYRNGATASALINEDMSGHQDIVIVNEGAGILRWYDNKFFAKDLPTELTPANYTPASTSVKDHLSAIDTKFGTLSVSGIPVGMYFPWATADLAGKPANALVADAAGATNSGTLNRASDTDLTADGGTWLVMGNGTVATPTVDIPAGTYASTQNVSISTATSGAVIRYTTNGVDPTMSDSLYSTPVPISVSGTLKAKAFKTSLYAPSSVFSAAYTINSVSYLIEDDLIYGSSGAAVTAGWVNSGSPNWTFTPANSGYASSLRTFWGDTTYRNFTATGEVWVTIYFTPTTFTSASNILSLGDGTNTALRVKLDPAGDIYVAVGTSGGTYIHSSYTVGTKYRLDVRAKKGTGANSEAAFYLSTTTSKGSLVGTITNGAYATDISRIALQATTNLTVIWNGLKVDDVVIP